MYVSSLKYHIESIVFMHIPVGNVLLSSRVTIGRGELDTIVLYM